eukprot:GEZU01006014.1.p1 GENE.GEZU01006014.1~~GEZU01006014.1.p1  ORF type:complete len:163 (+),score=9.66 GEZU01006014.1:565-1053(+)
MKKPSHSFVLLLVVLLLLLFLLTSGIGAIVDNCDTLSPSQCITSPNCRLVTGTPCCSEQPPASVCISKDTICAQVLTCAVDQSTFVVYQFPDACALLSPRFGPFTPTTCELVRCRAGFHCEEVNTCKLGDGVTAEPRKSILEDSPCCLRAACVPDYKKCRAR